MEDKLKRARKSIREQVRKGVDATEEQLKFLTEHFKDVDYIIGIHNTYIPPDDILKNGLHNYTSVYNKTNEITNTVMYSGQLISLAMYPNGDGNKREETAIILKIPKDVLMQKQGIFEVLPDGKYGIPSQFILGAFQDGKVIENPKYDKGYNNPNAEFCRKEANIYEFDRNLQIDAFWAEYEAWEKSIKNKIGKFIQKLKQGNKTKALPPAKQCIEEEKQESNSFVDSLKYDVNSIHMENRHMNENDRMNDTKDIEINQKDER